MLRINDDMNNQITYINTAYVNGVSIEDTLRHKDLIINILDISMRINFDKEKGDLSRRSFFEVVCENIKLSKIIPPSEDITTELENGNLKDIALMVLTKKEEDNYSSTFVKYGNQNIADICLYGDVTNFENLKNDLGKFVTVTINMQCSEGEKDVKDN